ncbi:unnamed protein product [Prunus armeniaca]
MGLLGPFLRSTLAWQETCSISTIAMKISNPHSMLLNSAKLPMKLSMKISNYQKHKAELDMMVADYKESKTVPDKLEKHIMELQKQLASLRDKQNKLGAGLGTKTKATFLVQNMVPASKPTLEIAEASLHQGMLLQQEISTKTVGLQKTLGKLGL